MKLLTPPNSQHKALKSLSVGVLSYTLHLAPATLARRGPDDKWTSCPLASKGCAAACLNTAGMGIFPGVQAARLNRTNFFRDSSDVFMAQLHNEIRLAQRAADRRSLRLAVRLNGTSDILWERIAIAPWRNMMQAFPNVQFFDYTKIHARFNSPLPSNYHLTYSLSERPDSLTHAQRVLANGGNVAVVFATELPATFLGHPVIDATAHDARFLDPPASIAGLLALGKARFDTSGFVQLSLKEVAA